MWIAFLRDFLLYFFLWNDLLNCSPVSSTTFCDTQSQIGRCRIVSILITGAIHQKRTSRRYFYLKVHSRFEFQIGHYRITTTQRLIQKGPILDSYLSFTCIQILRRSNKNILWQVCANELNLSISWVGSLLTDSELFILFSENSQILCRDVSTKATGAT